MRRDTIPAGGAGRRRDGRRGVAAVEFAVVASLLFVLILGIIEMGRAMMVLEMLNNAARNGARVGSLQGAVKSDVTDPTSGAIAQALANSGINGWTATVSDNGTALANASDSTGVSGDTLTVTVQVPYNNVTWLPTSMFLAGRTLGSTVVMRHE
jgi:Flp pilus assembly protein TadG